MQPRAPHLRVNPGGWLTPSEVVGRDGFIASMWRAIERQSVLLTAERRMGKTSVLRKMLAEPSGGAYAIKRSLQGISTPDEFVRGLLVDTERALPGVLKRRVWRRLTAAGVRKIGVSPVSVEFEPTAADSWKDVAEETFRVLDSEVDATVVFLWDELPHMVASIRDNCDPLVARQVLDLLRALRESCTAVRMVLSGSLGLHHVVDGLRGHGGMWVPTHDMLVMDLPPLTADDATYLAGELLHNERIACDDVETVAHSIASEVGGTPYYVHHTVHQLLGRERSGCGRVDVPLVREVIEEAIRDPLDPWQLQHYMDRVSTYYGGDADVIKAILDVVAGAGDGLDVEAIHLRIGAHLRPPSIERVREILALLCKDHYLDGGPIYTFKLGLVRRAWVAKRGPQ